MRPDELRKARGVYYGKITNLDHQLGRLLGQLGADGQLRETFIVYASDHGEMLGDCGDMAKSNFLAASARVPLIVRPHASAQAEPGREIDALVGLDDLLPTLCEAAGARLPPGITGKSWQPLLRGEAATLHDFQHGQIENSHMYHDGRMKYLYFAEDGAELLFDTAIDPGDQHDLSGDEGLCAPFRRALLDHLIAEEHAHAAGGRLLNLGRAAPDAAQLRAAAPLGWPAFAAGPHAV